MIFRDRHEEVRDRMREKLRKKRAQRRYNKRAHAAESPFGQVKGNLKFRALMRRGVEKVKMEVALLFMLHNMMRMAAARV
jgi:IS5 family transposase